MDINQQVQELIRLANERCNAEIRAYLSPLVGLEVDGGCGECDAFQEVVLDDIADGLHRISIHHEEDCPLALQAGDEFLRTLAQINGLPETGAP